ncbi:ABC transporter substrate-binding protein [Neoroseomonas oryzicola]|uniref:ABC transporter substrate-binding protein n=1 Tax=Neoroseomonas oryzicola TaxID=535904 RepID=A0A9X9WG27_9PROT|nr:ABC transporter substrate-binding protein [Neoroseomonas oryzicola]MBR0659287.1 ABC transporter substrate-binding protein [Neoroseomonas oryzicola]NKE15579.1 ABC transporter substrate-binding protein [Neoroseomonas oryzicola]
MNETSRRGLLAGAAALPVLSGLAAPRGARAQAANTIKIGLLSDMSGPYRDLNGPNSIAAARLAMQEMAPRGLTLDLVVADHQNRPDVGVNIARQWFDRDGVDMVLNLAASSVALAVSDLAREKNKVMIATSTATSDLTGRACNANTIHWVYDTYMLAKSTGSAMVRAGGDTWFFITADYAFGHALERDTSTFVRNAGGRIVGSARTPFPGTTDFSSFLLQAQASRAKVIGLANAGTDTTNCIKQAAEFGLTRRGIKLASMLMFITDVHALGLETAQGLVCSASYYWDMNDQTRDVARRVRAIAGGDTPVAMSHAGDYSGTLHYLKAVLDMGVPAAKADGRAVVARMKAMPTQDNAFGAGSIRPDGRKIHPVYLFEVKTPAESRGQHDYYKLLQTSSPEDAFRPLNEGGCSLVRS